ncbi:MAG: M20/M25/M40 family metallo-hydrolase [Sphaerochaetaceae bacterium]
MQLLLDTFSKLVSLDSVSYEEDEISLFLETALLKAGLHTEYDAGENLYGYLPGTGNTILLNAHMDTVTLARGANVLEDGDILKSDGTTALGADDKAAIAAILTALNTLQHEKLAHPNLVILFTRSEEQGLVGAQNIEKEKLSNVTYGFTFDASGPVGGAISAAPSQDKIGAVFHGRGAHAGFKPETGISAIQMASQAVAFMKLLRIDEETTANVGSFIAQGATNIVCDKAQLELESRSLSPTKLAKQVASMIEAMQHAARDYGGSVDITHEHQYEAYRHQSDATVLKHFKQACNNCSLPFWVAPTLGGSDANILNKLGIETLVCTTGYEEPHTINEYIPRKELENLYSLVLELITL